jgi:hypothetical protein
VHVQQAGHELPLAAIAPAALRARRRWRVMVMLLALCFIAPVIVALVWLRGELDDATGQSAIAKPIPGAPGPYEPRLASAYRRYLQSESRARRGSAFANCAMALNTLMVPGGGGAAGGGPRTVSEDELLFYLGPPDLMRAAGGRTSYVYFYDRYGTKDWAVYVDVGTSRGQRVVAQMGWNASNVNNHGTYRPYSAGAGIGPTPTPR